MIFSVNNVDDVLDILSIRRLSEKSRDKIIIKIMYKFWKSMMKVYFCIPFS